MKKPPQNIRGLKPGMSLIEVMLVVLIIAILALMAMPGLLAAVPTFEARSAAQTTSSLMLMARRTAAATQKPARAVVDCSPGPLPCQLRLYTAVFNQKGELVDWDRKADANRSLADRVTVETDGAKQYPSSPDHVYWAVFLPSGQVRTSHLPMELTLKGEGAPRTWELALDPATGQITTQRKENK
jgi:prepilin-type N-terminal cleavage/methylation domain